MTVSKATNDGDSLRLNSPAARQAAVFTVLFQGLGKIAGLLVVLLLVRVLSEAEYGAYNVYYSVIALIGTVFSLGLTNTLARFLPEYHKNHLDGFAHRLYRYASYARLAANAIVLAALWVYWEPISGLLQLGEFDRVFGLFACIVVTHFQTSILSTTLSAYLLQKYSLSGQLLFTVAKLFCYVYFLFVEDASLTNVLAADMAAYAILYVWLKYQYIRNAPPAKNRTRQNSKLERKRVTRYAFFYNFSDFGQFSIGNKVDYLFLAAMLDPVSVGAYALATKLEKIARDVMPVKFFQGVVRSMFFTLDIRKDRQKVDVYFQLLCRITYILMFPAAAFVVLAYEPITVGLLGGKFQDYSTLIAVVFAFMVLSGFQKPLMLVIQLAERAGPVMFSKLFGILNLAALYILIPVWGVLGAAVATGTTLFLSRVFLWCFVRRIISFRALNAFLGYSAAYWLTTTGVGFALLERISGPFYGLAFCVGFVGVAFLMYLRGPVLGAQDAAVLNDTLKTRERDLLRRIGLLKGVVRAAGSKNER